MEDIEARIRKAVEAEREWCAAMCDHAAELQENRDRRQVSRTPNWTDRSAKAAGP